MFLTALSMADIVILLHALQVTYLQETSFMEMHGAYPHAVRLFLAIVLTLVWVAACLWVIYQSNFGPYSRGEGRLWPVQTGRHQD